VRAPPCSHYTTIPHSSSSPIIQSFTSIATANLASAGRIQYDSSSTSYTSSNSFVAGTSCTGLNSTTLLPNYQTGPSSAYTAVAAGAAQQGTWFPGVPCSVTVTGSGCYLAWSNATHYYEEGNYVLPGLSYASGCPDCSRATASSDGTCRCGSGCLPG
jgi:hypothetical protein